MTSDRLPCIVLPAGRARLLAVLLLLGLAGLTARAVYLQGMHNGFLQQKGESRHSRILEMSAHRGMITDRHGEPLAISTPVESVWSSPQDMNATPEQLKKLAGLIGLDVGEIRKRLGWIPAWIRARFCIFEASLVAGGGGQGGRTQHSRCIS